MVYIGFATHSYNIDMHLLKFTDSEEENQDEDSEFSERGHFKEVLKVERIDASLTPAKLIILVTEPGTYKIIWDNSFSWLTSKKLRCRVSVLRPLEKIDPSKAIKQIEEEKKEIEKSEPQEIKEIEMQDKSNESKSKIVSLKLNGENRDLNISLVTRMSKLYDSGDQKHINLLVSKSKISVLDGFSIIEECENNCGSLESTVCKILDRNEYDNKSVLVNVYLCEKYTVESETIPVETDEAYLNAFTKLGYFPEGLVKHRNFYRMNLINIAEGFVLYSIYCQNENENQLKNRIHVHLEKESKIVSMLFEGIIHDKISGFNYDNSKTFEQNLENIAEFINKIHVLFGGFVLSFSSIGIEIRQEFLEELKSKISSDKPEDIAVKVISSEEVKDGFKIIPQFY